MEIAGLVLGGIPIAIQALDTYRTILYSMKNARRDLEDMMLVLETQNQILQNTCQLLLRDIVPDSQLDAMTSNPFRPAWKSYDEEISTRLHRASSAFQQTVTAMEKAVYELQQKLAVDENGKVRAFFC